MIVEILKISDFLTLIIASIVMLFIIYFIIKRINKKKIQSNIAQIKKSVVHSVTEPSITILKKKSNYEIPDVHKENQRPKINIKKSWAVPGAGSSSSLTVSGPLACSHH